MKLFTRCNHLYKKPIFFRMLMCNSRSYNYIYNIKIIMYKIVVFDKIKNNMILMKFCFMNIYKVFNNTRIHNKINFYLTNTFL